MTHALKTWPEYFKALEQGYKRFELRKDDRPYKSGDRFLAQEFDPKTNQYTGKELTFHIDYVLRNAEQFGLKDGYCIIQLIESAI